MSEQKEQHEQVIETKEEVQEEALEISRSEERPEEVHTEVTKEEENPESEALTEISDEEHQDIDAQIANLAKQDAAVLLIKKAKHIVHDTETQMEACKLLLTDDLKEFDAAKVSLKEGGLDGCEAMLDRLGYQGTEEGESPEEEMVVFEAKEEVPPVYIGNVSSGKFTGFLLALVFGAVTLAGLVYLATQKLGIAVDIHKVPAMETCKPVLTWFGSLVSMPKPEVGGALLGVAVLLVMWIVYTIRVSIKAGSNLQFAKAELEKAEEYATLKGSCKDEMDSVDAHIKESVETLKTYAVLLHEQEAKLKRIDYLENREEGEVNYHDRSRKEMEETHDLIKTVQAFLNTPMSEEGKLSGKSTLFLYRAKNRLEKMIERLY